MPSGRPPRSAQRGVLAPRRRLAAAQPLHHRLDLAGRDRALALQPPLGAPQPALVVRRRPGTRAGGIVSRVGRPPGPPPSRWYETSMCRAKTRASQSSWNTSSPPGSTTAPKPCMPPMSCTPSMAERLIARDLARPLARSTVVGAVAPEASVAGSWLGRALGRGRGVPDEAELVRQAQGGSEDALAALFELHWPRLFRAALAVTADARRRRGRRAGGVHRRRRRPRPLRPLAALRPVAAPHRRQPRDRPRTLRARRGASSGVEGVPEPGVAARRAGRRRPGRRAGRRRCRRSSARWSRCATSSTTRRARSPTLLELPRGTVNSRLRRGLDALAERLGEEATR